jgi:hypothetical protein
MAERNDEHRMGHVHGSMDEGVIGVERRPGPLLVNPATAQAQRQRSGTSLKYCQAERGNAVAMRTGRRRRSPLPDKAENRKIRALGPPAPPLSLSFRSFNCPTITPSLPRIGTHQVSSMLR